MATVFLTYTGGSKFIRNLCDRLFIKKFALDSEEEIEEQEGDVEPTLKRYVI